MESRSEPKKKRLASEPRLAEVARGALQKGEAAASSEPELAVFAKEMRALLGFDRLPDPPESWSVRLASGELALRRTLATGTLELRRWEGELRLFRRPVGDLKRTVERALERSLGEELLRETFEDGEVVEWAAFGPFERLLAVREGRSVLLRFAPRLDQAPFETAHERAADVALTRFRERARPPGPWAVPSPLFMPSGGRFPKRAPVRKKRVKR